MGFIPSVVEQTHRGERGWDIFCHLLKGRLIFLGTPVSDDVPNSIIAQLLYSESEDPGDDVECARHEVLSQAQHSRNFFIDYPEMVDEISGF